MDETFNRLIRRTNETKLIVKGDPWDIIPIKNKKYATECTEIHLGNRGIERLVRFEDFPNLEVLWINNNKLEKIDGLDENFRIKHLYAHDNKIKTLRGSLEKFLHLETLLVYNNELRGLDSTIEFLKDFPYITQLDLFGNPLAEEPNYRLKLIGNFPQLEILDRHVIYGPERKLAKEFLLKEEEREKKSKKAGFLRWEDSSNNMSDAKKKLQSQKNLSIIEREMYKEVRLVKQNKREKIIAERERMSSLGRRIVSQGSTMPKPTVVWEIPDNGGEDPLKYITEWEKNKLRAVFKTYDKDKKGMIEFEALKTIYDDLKLDKALVGKMPKCSLDEFINMYKVEGAAQAQTQAQSKLSWDDFRLKLNKTEWTKTTLESLQATINEKYYEANKLKNGGKDKEAFERLFKAIRLENYLHMDKETNQAFKNKKEEKKSTRHDYFNFGAYKFRKDFPDTQKEII